MALESDLSKMSISGDATAPAMPPPATQTTTVSTPPAAVPAPSIPATPSPQTAFSLRSFAEEQGYDPNNFTDEKELATALFQAVQQFQQNEPLAAIGRQFAPYADKMAEIQEFLKTKELEARKAAEAVKATAAPALDWRKVEYDSALERRCQLNQQTGLYEPIHPDFAPDARRLNDAMEARRYNSQRVVDNLPGILDEYYSPRETALLEKMTKQISEQIQQAFSSYEQENTTDTWIKEREKDLYVFDANGNVSIGLDGNPRLTAKGEALKTHADSLGKSGLSDPVKIREYAWLAVMADEAAGKFGQTTNTPPAATIPPQPKRFLNRLQQRGGSIPDDSAQRTINESPSGDLREIVTRLANEQGIKL